MSARAWITKDKSGRTVYPLMGERRQEAIRLMVKSVLFQEAG